MTLEEPNKIDITGKTKDGKIFLAITDVGITTNPDERFQKLIMKIKSYMNYVMGDAFKKEHPKVKPKDVIIKVICKNEPTDQMKQIENVGPTGDKENRISVTYEVMK